MIALKKGVPRIHYYNQDFVDLYVRSWNLIDAQWARGTKASGFEGSMFHQKDKVDISVTDACFSSFYLVYSNKVYSAFATLDAIYAKQELSGAIRSHYNFTTGEAILAENNPLGLAPPIFAWVEFDIYHKIGIKKRVKDVLPILGDYFNWLDQVAFDETLGLYHAPLSASIMVDCKPRKDALYLIDFNCQQALNALYMSYLADIMNDKELSFRYKKRYFMLKTKINALMWSEDAGFYFDLDESGNQIKARTLAAYWALLAELPTEENADRLIAHLHDPDGFATPNPFPSIAVNESDFNAKGDGFNGGVYPELTYIVIKGLEKFKKFEFAREAAAKHIYFILDRMHPDGDGVGHFWQSYQPLSDGIAWVGDGKENANQKDILTMVCLATITLMIENIVGLIISLPRKTVDWIVPTLELMGIENLSLKRNIISILCVKNHRQSWEIRLKSEKLYYFTVNLVNIKKKTLPIPSGQCSMLIEKL
ncbi:MGH1-like glycoside hydrolase domain-containing protein [Entomospira culicis]|uniref:Mannosylglycerate hydrolase MGH1-like glycoside hydrolase domain-containing protein n=1 Tax=Entomospira culicis TaxID=2719989 RepID=A0A968GJ62_9SPIO|nr:trehalase family glycosidase [Entomospira culicis]NIZ19450.1 hypothetical protein [Entomospira culicis]NIZ69645.1 hypothetical protein [Entomospira culicis]WDI36756.1 trehalase family glycosidase [Entomospira culicis]WDI38385.1 trehalase family glycosidase [Entomospira culicis]